MASAMRAPSHAGSASGARTSDAASSKRLRAIARTTRKTAFFTITANP